MFNPISCGMCIAKVSTRIQGYDPRQMIKDCAWKCMKNGKGGQAFKRCLRKKVLGLVNDANHADQIVNDIWNDIKNKCKA